MSIGCVVLKLTDRIDLELGGPVATAGVTSHLTRQIALALITDVTHLNVVCLRYEPDKFDAVSYDSVMR